MIDIIHIDEQIIVCVKPCRVLSTDEAGGLPELLREQLGLDTVLTVHRLDRVVGGLMVLARNAEVAAAVSQQIMDRRFDKEYLAVIHGVPEETSGTFTDLLYRDKRECKTYVTDTPAKGVQDAVLDYEALESTGQLTLVRVLLRTGRTHQIRAQFSSRGLPLVGDRKYSENDDPCEIALWSHKIGFIHPATGERVSFTAPLPETYPWTEFKKI